VKRFQWVGHLLGVLSVLVYLALAVNRGKSPSLVAAILGFVSVIAFIGAIRLVVVGMSRTFEDSAKSLERQEVVVAGIALAWASAQAYLDILAGISN
jgi:hypothetical protein